ncbi:hypothetical protein BJ878DRAFT_563874 [Calycina marina]|uniref:cellulase n=1 Tax=Calycina marina TaxID=1763456 RepID=A0A9P8CJ65_9HELO|nr:hypothetical protein BJ878DRAFT_563874 [Calycina marina]
MVCPFRDIPNYARVSKQIVGQGGPTDSVRRPVESAGHETSRSRPRHFRPAATAIRGTGATSQRVLLPGNDFASASQFISSGSGTTLLGITNPDSSTTGLIMDLHKYLDVDNSGEHACFTAFCTQNAFLDANSDLFLGYVAWAAGHFSSSCVLNLMPTQQNGK